ncbi:MAG: MFS transporter [Propionicimonas sp.]|uniref:MFS transporter n=1 Tax=Propionicimonas sp. TaxID=1955623 RepID=UPI003D0D5EF9
MDTTIPGATATAGTPHRWRRLALATVLGAEIMDLLDSTIVNLAATPIEKDLGGGAGTIQWVVGAYTLAFAVGLVLSGRLGDRFGRRRLFLIGTVGFTLASLACATAHDPSVLIASRAGQGLIGALLIPQGFGLIREVFPASELGAAMGSFGPVIGLSSVVGPLLGGALVSADVFGLGWRVIFLINLPIGALTLCGALLFIPARPGDPALRIDPVGAALLGLASLLLVYPLIEGPGRGWPWWTFALVAGSVACFVWFGRNERRSSAPVIEPTLLRNRAFLGGVGVITLAFAAMIGNTLVFNTYTQSALGYTALQAAFAGSAYALGMAVAAAAGSAALLPRLGRRLLALGFALMIVGAGLQLLTIHAAGSSAQPWVFLPAGFVFGVGSGFGLVPAFSVVLGGVADREVGSASGLMNALQQLGGTLGVAVCGSLYFSFLALGPVAAVQLAAAAAVVFLLGALALVRTLPRSPRPEAP